MPPPIPTPLILKAKTGKVEGKGEEGQICNRSSLCLSDKQIFEVVAEASKSAATLVPPPTEGHGSSPNTSPEESEKVLQNLSGLVH